MNVFWVEGYMTFHNTARWTLVALSAVLAGVVITGFAHSCHRSAEINNFVKVRFNPPTGTKIYVNGQEEARVVYLNTKYTHHIRYEVNGVTTKEFSFKPEQDNGHQILIP